MSEREELHRKPSNRKAAMDHCAAGIAGSVFLRADAIGHVNAAISADRSYALSYLAKAWMLHAAHDDRFSDKISGLLDKADQCGLAKDSYEHGLYSALKLINGAKEVDGVRVLEAILDKSPTDLFVHQLIQDEVFWMGRSDWMRSITEKAAPAWRETMKGYGSFLSFRAFANEEAGYLDDAEQYGRRAIEIDPTDIWGAHAVAHVLTMRGEMHKGIDWLENLSTNWEHGNQMKHHLWWHLCLFLLEVGDHDRVLALLTTEIRNPDSPMIKASPAATIDITNFSSLLLRLELLGVEVGEHWETLGEICADRVCNHKSAFSNTHDMMVLAATGQYDKADELLKSMRETYYSQSGTVAQSYNAVGISVCEAILAHRKKDYARVLALLGEIPQDLTLIGASHAQRDVYYYLLVHASKQGDRQDLRTVFLKDVERIGFHGVTERAAYKNTAH